MVPDQLIALGIIDQGRQIDHLQRSHGQYRLMDDACHRSNQNAFEERHNLLSDMGPMVAPLGSSASTLKPRMRSCGHQQLERAGAATLLTHPPMPQNVAWRK